MNRRRILATTGLAVSTPLTGCLDDLTELTSSDGVITPSNAVPPGSSNPNCGVADQPLSTRLGDDPEDEESRGPNCGSGTRPSLALENEREEPVTVTIDAGGGDFTETYALNVGEFVVEQAGFEVSSEGAEVTVTVSGEETTVRWPTLSCLQHGIALTPRGIEIGWVERLFGWDTQHECYPGDPAYVRVWNRGQTRTITATATDLCADSTWIETFELDAGGGKTYGEALVSGGMYDVTIDVEDGGSVTYEFHEKCQGVHTLIEEDGDITMEMGDMY